MSGCSSARKTLQGGPKKGNFMLGRMITSKVMDGRARIVCSRCEKNRYIEVPLGLNGKLVRCRCGFSVFVRFDRRVFRREAMSGRAILSFPNGDRSPVYLCDYSLGGISFIFPDPHKGFLAVGQEILIQYPTLQGGFILRRIRLKTLRANRVGAEFLGYPED